MPSFLRYMAVCLLLVAITGCAGRNEKAQVRQAPLVSAEAAAVPSGGLPPDKTSPNSPRLKNSSQRAALSTRPTSGPLSSTYGMRKLGGKKAARFHKGVDLNAKRGTSVVASASGVVTFVGKKDAYGKIVEIDHGNGLVTRYAHLDSFSVKQGARITAGKRIGTVGRTGRTTGPNLHFEVLVNNKHIDPLRLVRWG